MTATYGCGPTDGPLITVEGHDLGSRDVVVDIVFDGTKTNRSAPMAGPEIALDVQPARPRAAYEVGTAQVRIVEHGEPFTTIVETDVSLEMTGRCG